MLPQGLKGKKPRSTEVLNDERLTCDQNPYVTGQKNSFSKEQMLEATIIEH